MLCAKLDFLSQGLSIPVPNLNPKFFNRTVNRITHDKATVARVLVSTNPIKALCWRNVTFDAARIRGGTEGACSTSGSSTDFMLNRFLAYCRVATTADEHSKATPSSEGQWELLRLVQADLVNAGLVQADLELLEQGYLVANVPATPGLEHRPKLAFFAHVDTAHDFSGEGVKPVVHQNYSGAPITFAANSKLVLDPSDFPILKEKVGDTIITASGDTLLGADDKAGVAILVALVKDLLRDGSAHGPVAVAFGPDEEVHVLQPPPLGAQGGCRAL
ncbi:hypothetical protein CYMTET_48245 [Cymbomonas tetramitiformis]|uniref:Peptidase T n=1 Tax=Cymbomonas tetramitiformis TaxID=36881 RepID=A0AAE0BUK1_9CHLO|nr:hypothetical protein CYMTET_48245 [Cymbomonas tetramitiformis]